MNEPSHRSDHLCSDIHILLNTIHSPSILNSPASSSWIPVCLPKFNPSGFVNAYISFLSRDKKPDEVLDGTIPASESIYIEDEVVNSEPTLTQKKVPSTNATSDVALVCISGGGEFDAIRGWCDSVTQVCH